MSKVKTKCPEPRVRDFGWAINQMKRGYRVQRSGWNGRDMFIYLEKWEAVPTNDLIEPCICMYTAQGRRQPGWLASQADMLATDWGPAGPPR